MSLKSDKAQDAAHVTVGGLVAVVVTLLIAVMLPGCATPSVISIREREKLTAQGEVTADVTASDMAEYILAQETKSLNQANAETNEDYTLRLSVARNAEEGASLALQWAAGLEANRQAFLAELDKQMVMVERLLLVKEALTAVNGMASKEATIVRRTFDEFERNELPRIMEEARAGIAEVVEYQERERIRKEAERAAREAELKAAEEAAREEEHEEPELPKPEPPRPPDVPNPTTPDNTGD